MTRSQARIPFGTHSNNDGKVMFSNSQTPHAKANTACLNCKRRKLKCVREKEEGVKCINCTKADLLCLYPSDQDYGLGRKRKRGPYKKGKPESADQDVNLPSPRSNLAGVEGTAETKKDPDHLVRDALITLTSAAAVVEKESDTGNIPSSPAEREARALVQHPPGHRIFHYWHLFVTRFDPLTKVIHVPTFGNLIVGSLGELADLPTATQALLFSTYHAAVSTCAPLEVESKFHASRESLLDEYSRSMAASLIESHNTPTFETLQALIMYLIARQRADEPTSVHALYSRAVDIAYTLSLHTDPSKHCPPLEAELRRRLWWHLCGLESRGAEEAFSKSYSIFDNGSVALPSNICDFDLHADMHTPPVARPGRTDTTFVLLRFEIASISHQIWKIARSRESEAGKKSVGTIRNEQRRLLSESKTRLESAYLRYLDASRPYDTLCIRFVKAMLIKARLAIDHSFAEMPGKQMTPEERFELLQASVEIISLCNALGSHKGAKPWLWYFRNWKQWHSIAIVVAELRQSSDQCFVERALAALEPILTKWKSMYDLKQGEPAWDHVNTLIDHARRVSSNVMRYQQAGHLDPASARSSEPVEALSGEELDERFPLEANSITRNGTHTRSQQDCSSYLHGVTQPTGSLSAADVLLQTECTSSIFAVADDVGCINGIGEIDFRSFDTVFGDTSWDILDLNDQWNPEGSVL